MEAVTVSPKFQVVIPAQIRRNLGIEPGQKFWVLEYDGRIELLPVTSLRALRGSLKGIDTTVPREPDRV